MVDYGRSKEENCKSIKKVWLAHIKISFLSPQHPIQLPVILFPPELRQWLSSRTRFAKHWKVEYYSRAHDNPLVWVWETGVSSSDLLHLRLHLLLQMWAKLGSSGTRPSVCFNRNFVYVLFWDGREYDLFLWSCCSMLVRVELFCLQF